MASHRKLPSLSGPHPQLPADVAAPRSGSALRTGCFKSASLLCNNRALRRVVLLRLRSALADLTFRPAPDPRLRGPAPGDQRSAAGPRPATCRCGVPLRGFYLFFIYILHRATSVPPPDRVRQRAGAECRFAVFIFYFFLFLFLRRPERFPAPAVP